MSKESKPSQSYSESLAAAIVKRLGEKKALKRTRDLPFHLDRRKFLHFVRRDVAAVIEEHKEGAA